MKKFDAWPGARLKDGARPGGKSGSGAVLEGRPLGRSPAPGLGRKAREGTELADEVALVREAELEGEVRPVDVAALRRGCARGPAGCGADDRGALCALEAAETEKRRLLTAGIEARKNTLAAKRALLDRAFDEAVAQLCALDDKTYAALVTRLVVAGSETGSEALRVPAAHRDRYTKPFVGGKTQLEALNEALCAAGKKGALTLDAEPAKFRGGVLLVGPEADIDCSFEALVAAFRDTHEAEVSARLFTEE